MNLIAVSDADFKGIIKFICLIGLVWLVTGLISTIPTMPAWGTRCLYIIAAVATILLSVQFFNLM